MIRHYHRILARLYGLLASRLLGHAGVHAASIDDWLTYDRVWAVLQVGYMNGWDGRTLDRHVTANRAGWNHTSDGHRWSRSIFRGSDTPNRKEDA